MKVLLTGASGFLGKIIHKTLFQHQITSLGRTGADINVDLSIKVPTLPIVDVVVHAAGKAHMVPKTIEEKQAFFDMNVTGTQHLLMALQNALILPKAFVFISSVAVYGLEKGILINEDSPLLASDAYGKSKIQAEILVQDWCKECGVICTILRLPLVAGPHPPGNLQSMINGIKNGYYFNIGGGMAKKSVVMAKDVAKIIPKAADIGGIYHLTDGQHPSIFDLSSVIATQLNKSIPFNIPNWSASLVGKIGDVVGKKSPINTDKVKKMTSDLTFDDSKAYQVLAWHPQKVLDAFKIN